MIFDTRICLYVFKCVINILCCGVYVMSKTASVRFYQSSKKRVSFEQGVVQFN